MSPKHSIEVSSSACEFWKVVMCLTGKVGVLEKLHPGMSRSAVAVRSREGIYNRCQIQCFQTEAHRKSGSVLMG